MPYKNEHIAKIINTEGVNSFEREELVPGVGAIFTVDDNSKVAHSYRFDKMKFTSSQAKDWLKNHKIDIIDFEPALKDQQKLKMNVECGECGFVFESKKELKNVLCPECGVDDVDIFQDGEKIEMKLETKTLKDVHMFTVGEWKGRDFTTDDVDQMIDNVRNKVAEPYLNINHDDNTTKQWRNDLKCLSLGFLDNIRRVGKDVYTDIKQVPKLVAQLIDAGSLKKKSVEWWNNYRHGNGKIYPNVLQAVTFHGADGLPAISTLEDTVKLFKDRTIEHADQDEKELISIVLNEFKTTEEKKPMENIEIKKDEYTELLKFKNEASEKDVVIEKLKTDVEEKDQAIGDATKENDDLKKENEDLKKEGEGVAEEKKENLKNEAETFVKSIIDDKKLMPKYNDMKVAEYIRLKNDSNEDGLKLFKEELESRDEVINLSGTEGMDGEIDINNLKMDDPDEVNKVVESLMKKEKIDFKTACQKLDIAI